jgi:molecular chaperone HtpG
VVINSNHKLVEKVREQKDKKVGAKIEKILEELKPMEEEKKRLEKAKEGKKDEEINQAEKNKLSDVEKKINALQEKKKELLIKHGKENKYVKQLIDLALLANNMLKGEELTKFVKRSVELIK